MQIQLNSIPTFILRAYDFLAARGKFEDNYLQNMNITTGWLRQQLYQHFPIVEYVLEQNKTLLTKRPVDMNWFYKGIVPVSVAGFNPLGSQIFYGKNSYLEKFLEQEIEILPNEIDWYLYEVFFAVHDYMHLWTVDQLLDFFPQCTKKTMFSDKDTLEDLAFILLISEVVASTSLDWWMLSKIDLAKKLNVATKFRCLTTPFKMQDFTVAQQISTTFSVLDKSFFMWLTDGYFHNIFKGFEGIDQKSAATIPWLQKELQYGYKQRELLGKWITFLREDDNDLENIRFNYTTTARLNSVDYLASHIWTTINSGEFDALKIRFENSVPMPDPLPSLNFEFIDALFFIDELKNIDPKSMSDRNFAYLTAQVMSFQTWDIQNNCNPETFDTIVYTKDMQQLLRIAATINPKPSIRNLSTHLFIPN